MCREISPVSKISLKSWYSYYFLNRKQISRFSVSTTILTFKKFPSTVSTRVHVCVCVGAQSCSTLCDPMDCSPPGSSVHGISQVRILERAAISSSRDLPDPGTEPRTPSLWHWQAGSLSAGRPGAPTVSELRAQPPGLRGLPGRAERSRLRPASRSLFSESSAHPRGPSSPPV